MNDTFRPVIRAAKSEPVQTDVRKPPVLSLKSGVNVENYKTLIEFGLVLN